MLRLRKIKIHHTRGERTEKRTSRRGSNFPINAKEDWGRNWGNAGKSGRGAKGKKKKTTPRGNAPKWGEENSTATLATNTASKKEREEE